MRRRQSVPVRKPDQEGPESGGQPGWVCDHGSLGQTVSQRGRERSAVSEASMERPGEMQLEKCPLEP